MSAPRSWVVFVKGIWKETDSWQLRDEEEEEKETFVLLKQVR
jgi:hypothetical protein